MSSPAVVPGRPRGRPALAERFGNAPTSRRQVRRYATQVVDLLLSGISADPD